MSGVRGLVLLRHRVQGPGVARHHAAHDAPLAQHPLEFCLHRELQLGPRARPQVLHVLRRRLVDEPANLAVVAPEPSAGADLRVDEQGIALVLLLLLAREDALNRRRRTVGAAVRGRASGRRERLLEVLLVRQRAVDGGEHAGLLALRQARGHGLRGEHRDVFHEDGVRFDPELVRAEPPDEPRVRLRLAVHEEHEPDTQRPNLRDDAPEHVRRVRRGDRDALHPELGALVAGHVEVPRVDVIQAHQHRRAKQAPAEEPDVEHAEPTQHHELVGGAVFQDVRVRDAPRADEPREPPASVRHPRVLGDLERRILRVVGLHVQVGIARVEHVIEAPDELEHAQEQEEEGEQPPARLEELDEREVDPARGAERVALVVVQAHHARAAERGGAAREHHGGAPGENRGVVLVRDVARHALHERLRGTLRHPHARVRHDRVGRSVEAHVRAVRGRVQADVIFRRAPEHRGGAVDALRAPLGARARARGVAKRRRHPHRGRRRVAHRARPGQGAAPRRPHRSRARVVVLLPGVNRATSG